MEPADKPRRAALYGRVSTTEQQPENQLVALRAFATARALWRGADYEPCVVVVKTDGNFSRFLYHCAGRAKCARADYPAVDSAASGPGDSNSTCSTNPPAPEQRRVEAAHASERSFSSPSTD